MYGVQRLIRYQTSFYGAVDRLCFTLVRFYMMNFSKIQVLLFWCCSAFAQQETSKGINRRNIDSIKILTVILGTNIWKNDVSWRKTLFGENATHQLEKLHQQLEFYENELTNTKDPIKKNKIEQQILFGISKSMFLKMKCKYSDIVISSLQYTFEMISSCDTKYLGEHEKKKCVNDVIKHFALQKKYFAKIMFNLFTFVDKFPNLKYSDQILLKSLAVVNLYLNCYLRYGKTEYGNDEVEKKIISQMINFLERFRSQKCIIDTVNYFKDCKQIRDACKSIKITNDFQQDLSQLFYQTSRDLETYSEKIVIANYEDSEFLQFNEEMYDTKYLILEHILTDEKYSSIGTISVKNKTKETVLNDMLKSVLQSFDIKTIFDFQKLFINVVIDLCHIQFHYFNDTKNGDFHPELLKLLSNLYVFITTALPNNYYPLNDVNSLRRLYETIQTKSFEYFNDINRSRYIITDDSILRNISVNTIVGWKSQNFIRKLPMSDLIQDIIGHKYFNSFLRYFKLFLSEPNTLDDYRLYGVNDGNDFSVRECLAMTMLRRNLVLFEVMMVKRKDETFRHKKFNGTNLTILKAIDIINSSLSHLYKEYRQLNKIRNILIPLSIRFKNAMQSSTEGLNGLVLEQQSLLVANLLEHIEINHCSAINYNADMFLEVFDDHDMLQHDDNGVAIDFNRKYVVDKMSCPTQIPDDKDKYASSTWINKYIPNDFFKYYNSQFNSDTINWDGTEDEVDDVFLSTKQAVIDHNYLFRFSLFKLKWFIHNIFKKMLYIAVHRDEYLRNSNHKPLAVIQEQLSSFNNLPFPNRIQEYLEPIFSAYKVIFDESDAVNYGNYAKEIQNMIKKELGYLDVVSIENTLDDDNNVRLVNADDNDGSPKSVTFLRREFEEDYKFLKTVLKFTENGKILLNNEDFFYIY